MGWVIRLDVHVSDGEGSELACGVRVKKSRSAIDNMKPNKCMEEG